MKSVVIMPMSRSPSTRSWKFKPVTVINFLLLSILVLYSNLDIASGSELVCNSTATLAVQDVPNMPEMLGVDCGRRTAKIRWKSMGDNGSPILYYLIQYNTSFTPDTWEMASRDVPASSTILRLGYIVSMSPWANYTFRVIARNKMGKSIPSHLSPVCLTMLDVPYKNPANVKVRGSTPSNLVISWTPMTEIEHNAPQFKYVVQWKPEDNSGPWQTHNVRDWRVRYLVIENQPTYRPYKIRVRAVNEVGESTAWPQEVIGYSGMAAPMHSPTNFKLVEKVDSTTAIFSWDPVDPEYIRGKFEGYKIQTWTDYIGDGGCCREVIVKNNVTTALMDQLVPFSKNYVVVRAHNTHYDGPTSEIIEVMTEEGVPSPVVWFDAYPLGATAMYLMWFKPEQPGGILTGYRIFYQKVVGNELGVLMEREPRITDPETKIAKLTGLEPGSKYRIHIRATTSRGAGGDADVDRRTEPKGQTAPLNKPKFTWAQITTDYNRTSAISVKWVPKGTGRAGSHFLVQYKLDGDTEYKSTPPEFNQLTTTVRGLEPGETYVIRVVSVDGDLFEMSDPEEIYVNPGGKIIVSRVKSRILDTAVNWSVMFLSWAWGG